MTGAQPTLHAEPVASTVGSPDILWVKFEDVRASVQRQEEKEELARIGGDAFGTSSAAMAADGAAAA